MINTTKLSFSQHDIKIARFAKALGHPARIAILKHLASLDTCCFTEISNVLPLAGSTVSQHLAELKKAGLIQGNIEPPKVQYCINYENWQMMEKYFKGLIDITIVKYEQV